LNLQKEITGLGYCMRRAVLVDEKYTNSFDEGIRRILTQLTDLAVHATFRAERFVSM